MEIRNRQAYYEYFIDDKLQAGIALLGTEVKSLRAGRVNLRDGYAQVMNGEIFLENVHISPYEQGNRFNHEPLRKRKLLMHKGEILPLFGQVREKGYTLVPLRMYFKKGRAKVEIGLAKGKKLHDKRESIKQKDVEREMKRYLN